MLQSKLHENRPIDGASSTGQCAPSKPTVTNSLFIQLLDRSMRSLLRLGKNSSIDAAMSKYLQDIKVHADLCLNTRIAQRDREMTPFKLKHYLLQAIMTFHMHQQDLNESLDSSGSYVNCMCELLTLYAHAEANCWQRRRVKAIKSPGVVDSAVLATMDAEAASSITMTLGIILQGDSQYVVNVLIRCGSFLRQSHKSLFDEIFRTYLQYHKPNITTDTQLIPYILVYKVWEKLFPKDSDDSKYVRFLAEINLQLPIKFKMNNIQKVLPTLKKNKEIVNFYIQHPFDTDFACNKYLKQCSQSVPLSVNFEKMCTVNTMDDDISEEYSMVITSSTTLTSAPTSSSTLIEEPDDSSSAKQTPETAFTLSKCKQITNSEVILQDSCIDITSKLSCIDLTYDEQSSCEEEEPYMRANPHIEQSPSVVTNAGLSSSYIPTIVVDDDDEDDIIEIIDDEVPEKSWETSSAEPLLYRETVNVQTTEINNATNSMTNKSSQIPNTLNLKANPCSSKFTEQVDKWWLSKNRQRRVQRVSPITRGALQISTPERPVQNPVFPISPINPDISSLNSVSDVVNNVVPITNSESSSRVVHMTSLDLHSNTATDSNSSQISTPRLVPDNNALGDRSYPEIRIHPHIHSGEERRNLENFTEVTTIEEINNTVQKQIHNSPKNNLSETLAQEKQEVPASINEENVQLENISELDATFTKDSNVGYLDMDKTSVEKIMKDMYENLLQGDKSVHVIESTTEQEEMPIKDSSQLSICFELSAKGPVPLEVNASSDHIIDSMEQNRDYDRKSIPSTDILETDFNLSMPSNIELNNKSKQICGFSTICAKTVGMPIEEIMYKNPKELSENYENKQAIVLADKVNESKNIVGTSYNEKCTTFIIHHGESQVDEESHRESGQTSNENTCTLEMIDEQVIVPKSSENQTDFINRTDQISNNILLTEKNKEYDDLEDIEDEFEDGAQAVAEEMTEEMEDALLGEEEYTEDKQTENPVSKNYIYKDEQYAKLMTEYEENANKYSHDNTGKNKVIDTEMIAQTMEFNLTNCVSETKEEGNFYKNTDAKRQINEINNEIITTDEPNSMGDLCISQTKAAICEAEFQTTILDENLDSDNKNNMVTNKTETTNIGNKTMDHEGKFNDSIIVPNDEITLSLPICDFISSNNSVDDRVIEKDSFELVDESNNSVNDDLITPFVSSTKEVNFSNGEESINTSCLLDTELIERHPVCDMPIVSTGSSTVLEEKCEDSVKVTEYDMAQQLQTDSFEKSCNKADKSVLEKKISKLDDNRKDESVTSFFSSTKEVIVSITEECLNTSCMDRDLIEQNQTCTKRIVETEQKIENNTNNESTSTDEHVFVLEKNCEDSIIIANDILQPLQTDGFVKSCNKADESELENKTSKLDDKAKESVLDELITPFVSSTEEVNVSNMDECLNTSCTDRELIEQNQAFTKRIQERIENNINIEFTSTDKSLQTDGFAKSCNKAYENELQKKTSRLDDKAKESVHDELFTSFVSPTEEVNVSNMEECFNTSCIDKVLIEQNQEFTKNIQESIENNTNNEVTCTDKHVFVMEKKCQDSIMIANDEILQPLQTDGFVKRCNKADENELQKKTSRLDDKDKESVHDELITSFVSSTEEVNVSNMEEGLYTSCIDSELIEQNQAFTKHIVEIEGSIENNTNNTKTCDDSIIIADDEILQSLKTDGFVKSCNKADESELEKKTSRLDDKAKESSHGELITSFVSSTKEVNVSNMEECLNTSCIVRELIQQKQAFTNRIQESIENNTNNEITSTDKNVFVMEKKCQDSTIIASDEILQLLQTDGIVKSCNKVDENELQKKTSKLDDKVEEPANDELITSFVSSTEEANVSIREERLNISCIDQEIIERYKVCEKPIVEIEKSIENITEDYIINKSMYPDKEIFVSELKFKRHVIDTKSLNTIDQESLLMSTRHIVQLDQISKVSVENDCSKIEGTHNNDCKDVLPEDEGKLASFTSADCTVDVQDDKTIAENVPECLTDFPDVLECKVGSCMDNKAFEVEPDQGAQDIPVTTSAEPNEASTDKVTDMKVIESDVYMVERENISLSDLKMTTCENKDVLPSLENESNFEDQIVAAHICEEVKNGEVDGSVKLISFQLPSNEQNTKAFSHDEECEIKCFEGQVDCLKSSFEVDTLNKTETSAIEHADEAIQETITNENLFLTAAVINTTEHEVGLVPQDNDAESFSIVNKSLHSSEECKEGRNKNNENVSAVYETAAKNTIQEIHDNIDDGTNRSSLIDTFETYPYPNTTNETVQTPNTEATKACDRIKEVINVETIEDAVGFTTLPHTEDEMNEKSIVSNEEKIMSECRTFMADMCLIITEEIIKESMLENKTTVEQVNTSNDVDTSELQTASSELTNSVRVCEVIDDESVINNICEDSVSISTERNKITIEENKLNLPMTLGTYEPSLGIKSSLLKKHNKNYVKKNKEVAFSDNISINDTSIDTTENIISIDNKSKKTVSWKIPKKNKRKMKLSGNNKNKLDLVIKTEVNTHVEKHIGNKSNKPKPNYKKNSIYQKNKKIKKLCISSTIAKPLKEEASFSVVQNKEVVENLTSRKLITDDTLKNETTIESDNKLKTDTECHYNVNKSLHVVNEHKTVYETKQVNKKSKRPKKTNHLKTSSDINEDANFKIANVFFGGTDTAEMVSEVGATKSTKFATTECKLSNIESKKKGKSRRKLLGTGKIKKPKEENKSFFSALELVPKNRKYANFFIDTLLGESDAKKSCEMELVEQVPIENASNTNIDVVQNTAIEGKPWMGSSISNNRKLRKGSHCTSKNIQQQKSAPSNSNVTNNELIPLTDSATTAQISQHVPELQMLADVVDYLLQQNPDNTTKEIPTQIQNLHEQKNSEHHDSCISKLTCISDVKKSSYNKIVLDENTPISEYFSKRTVKKRTKPTSSQLKREFVNTKRCTRSSSREVKNAGNEEKQLHPVESIPPEAKTQKKPVDISQGKIKNGKKIAQYLGLNLPKDLEIFEAVPETPCINRPETTPVICLTNHKIKPVRMWQDRYFVNNARESVEESVLPDIQPAVKSNIVTIPEPTNALNVGERNSNLEALQNLIGNDYQENNLKMDINNMSPVSLDMTNSSQTPIDLSFKVISKIPLPPDISSSDLKGNLGRVLTSNVPIVLKQFVISEPEVILPEAEYHPIDSQLSALKNVVKCKNMVATLSKEIFSLSISEKPGYCNKSSTHYMESSLKVDSDTKNDSYASCIKFEPYAIDLNKATDRTYLKSTEAVSYETPAALDHRSVLDIVPTHRVIVDADIGGVKPAILEDKHLSDKCQINSLSKEQHLYKYHKRVKEVVSTNLIPTNTGVNKFHEKFNNCNEVLIHRGDSGEVDKPYKGLQETSDGLFTFENKFQTDLTRDDTLETSIELVTLKDKLITDTPVTIKNREEISDIVKTSILVKEEDKQCKLQRKEGFPSKEVIDVDTDNDNNVKDYVENKEKLVKRGIVIPSTLLTEINEKTSDRKLQTEENIAKDDFLNDCSHTSKTTNQKGLFMEQVTESVSLHYKEFPSLPKMFRHIDKPESQKKEVKQDIDSPSERTMKQNKVCNEKVIKNITLVKTSGHDIKLSIVVKEGRKIGKTISQRKDKKTKEQTKDVQLTTEQITPMDITIANNTKTLQEHIKSPNLVKNTKKMDEIESQIRSNEQKEDINKLLPPAVNPIERTDALNDNDTDGTNSETIIGHKSKEQITSSDSVNTIANQTKTLKGVARSTVPLKKSKIVKKPESLTSKIKTTLEEDGKSPGLVNKSEKVENTESQIKENKSKGMKKVCPSTTKPPEVFNKNTITCDKSVHDRIIPNKSKLHIVKDSSDQNNERVTIVQTLEEVIKSPVLVKKSKKVDNTELRIKENKSKEETKNVCPPTTTPSEVLNGNANSTDKSVHDRIIHNKSKIQIVKASADQCNESVSIAHTSDGNTKSPVLVQRSKKVDNTELRIKEYKSKEEIKSVCPSITKPSEVLNESAVAGAMTICETISLNKSKIHIVKDSADQSNERVTAHVLEGDIKSPVLAKRSKKVDKTERQIKEKKSKEEIKNVCQPTTKPSEVLNETTIANNKSVHNKGKVHIVKDSADQNNVRVTSARTVEEDIKSPFVVKRSKKVDSTEIRIKGNKPKEEIKNVCQPTTKPSEVFNENKIASDRSVHDRIIPNKSKIHIVKDSDELKDDIKSPVLVKRSNKVDKTELQIKEKKSKEETKNVCTPTTKPSEVLNEDTITTDKSVHDRIIPNKSKIHIVKDSADQSEVQITAHTLEEDIKTPVVVKRSKKVDNTELRIKEKKSKEETKNFCTPTTKPSEVLNEDTITTDKSVHDRIIPNKSKIHIVKDSADQSNVQVTAHTLEEDIKTPVAVKRTKKVDNTELRIKENKSKEEIKNVCTPTNKPSEVLNEHTIASDKSVQDGIIHNKTKIRIVKDSADQSNVSATITHTLGEDIKTLVLVKSKKVDKTELRIKDIKSKEEIKNFCFPTAKPSEVLKENTIASVKSVQDGISHNKSKIHIVKDSADLSNVPATIAHTLGEDIKTPVLVKSKKVDKTELRIKDIKSKEEIKNVCFPTAKPSEVLKENTIASDKSVQDGIIHNKSKIHIVKDSADQSNVSATIAHTLGEDIKSLVLVKSKKVDKTELQIKEKKSKEEIKTVCPPTTKQSEVLNENTIASVKSVQDGIIHNKSKIHIVKDSADLSNVSATIAHTLGEDIKTPVLVKSKKVDKTELRIKDIKSKEEIKTVCPPTTQPSEVLNENTIASVKSVQDGIIHNKSKIHIVKDSADLSNVSAAIAHTLGEDIKTPVLVKSKKVDKTELRIKDITSKEEIKTVCPPTTKPSEVLNENTIASVKSVQDGIIHNKSKIHIVKDSADLSNVSAAIAHTLGEDIKTPVLVKSKKVDKTELRIKDIKSKEEIKNFCFPTAKPSEVLKENTMVSVKSVQNIHNKSKIHIVKDSADQSNVSATIAHTLGEDIKSLVLVKSKKVDKTELQIKEKKSKEEIKTVCPPTTKPSEVLNENTITTDKSDRYDRIILNKSKMHIVKDSADQSNVRVTAHTLEEDIKSPVLVKRSKKVDDTELRIKENKSKDETKNVCTPTTKPSEVLNENTIATDKSVHDRIIPNKSKIHIVKDSDDQSNVRVTAHALIEDIKSPVLVKRRNKVDKTKQQIKEKKSKEETKNVCTPTPKPSEVLNENTIANNKSVDDRIIPNKSKIHIVKDAAEQSNDRVTAHTLDENTKSPVLVKRSKKVDKTELQIKDKKAKEETINVCPSITKPSEVLKENTIASDKSVHDRIIHNKGKVHIVKDSADQSNERVSIAHTLEEDNKSPVIVKRSKKIDNTELQTIGIKPKEDIKIVCALTTKPSEVLNENASASDKSICDRITLNKSKFHIVKDSADQSYERVTIARTMGEDIKSPVIGKRSKKVDNTELRTKEIKSKEEINNVCLPTIKPSEMLNENTIASDKAVQDTIIHNKSKIHILKDSAGQNNKRVTIAHTLQEDIKSPVTVKRSKKVDKTEQQIKEKRSKNVLKYMCESTNTPTGAINEYKIKSDKLVREGIILNNSKTQNTKDRVDQCNEGVIIANKMKTLEEDVKSIVSVNKSNKLGKTEPQNKNDKPKEEITSLCVLTNKTTDASNEHKITSSNKLLHDEIILNESKTEFTKDSDDKFYERVTIAKKARTLEKDVESPDLVKGSKSKKFDKVDSQNKDMSPEEDMTFVCTPTVKPIKPKDTLKEKNITNVNDDTTETKEHIVDQVTIAKNKLPISIKRKHYTEPKSKTKKLKQNITDTTQVTAKPTEVPIKNIPESVTSVTERIIDNKDYNTVQITSDPIHQVSNNAHSETILDKHVSKLTCETEKELPAYASFSNACIEPDLPLNMTGSTISMTRGTNVSLTFPPFAPSSINISTNSLYKPERIVVEPVRMLKSDLFEDISDEEFCETTIDDKHSFNKIMDQNIPAVTTEILQASRNCILDRKELQHFGNTAVNPTSESIGDMNSVSVYNIMSSSCSPTNVIDESDSKVAISVPEKINNTKQNYTIPEILIPNLILAPTNNLESVVAERSDTSGEFNNTTDVTGTIVKMDPNEAVQKQSLKSPIRDHELQFTLIEEVVKHINEMNEINGNSSDAMLVEFSKSSLDECDESAHSEYAEDDNESYRNDYSCQTHHTISDTEYTNPSSQASDSTSVSDSNSHSHLSNPASVNSQGSTQTDDDLGLFNSQQIHIQTENLFEKLLDENGPFEFDFEDINFDTIGEFESLDKLQSMSTDLCLMSDRSVVSSEKDSLISGRNSEYPVNGPGPKVLMNNLEEHHMSEIFTTEASMRQNSVPMQAILPIQIHSGGPGNSQVISNININNTTYVQGPTMFIQVNPVVYPSQYYNPNLMNHGGLTGNSGQNYPHQYFAGLSQGNAQMEMMGGHNQMQMQQLGHEYYPATVNHGQPGHSNEKFINNMLNNSYPMMNQAMYGAYMQQSSTMINDVSDNAYHPNSMMSDDNYVGFNRFVYKNVSSQYHIQQTQAQEQNVFMAQTIPEMHNQKAPTVTKAEVTQQVTADETTQATMQGQKFQPKTTSDEVEFDIDMLDSLLKPVEGKKDIPGSPLKTSNDIYVAKKADAQQKCSDTPERSMSVRKTAVSETPSNESGTSVQKLSSEMNKCGKIKAQPVSNKEIPATQTEGQKGICNRTNIFKTVTSPKKLPTGTKSISAPSDITTKKNIEPVGSPLKMKSYATAPRPTANTDNVKHKKRTSYDMPDLGDSLETHIQLDNRMENSDLSVVKRTLNIAKKPDCVYRVGSTTETRHEKSSNKTTSKTQPDTVKNVDFVSNTELSTKKETSSELFDKLIKSKDTCNIKVVPKSLSLAKPDVGKPELLTHNKDSSIKKETSSVSKSPSLGKSDVFPVCKYASEKISKKLPLDKINIVDNIDINGVEKTAARIKQEPKKYQGPPSIIRTDMLKTLETKDMVVEKNVEIGPVKSNKRNLVTVKLGQNKNMRRAETPPVEENIVASKQSTAVISNGDDMLAMLNQYSNDNRKRIRSGTEEQSPQKRARPSERSKTGRVSDPQYRSSHEQHVIQSNEKHHSSKYPYGKSGSSGSSSSSASGIRSVDDRSHSQHRNTPQVDMVPGKPREYDYSFSEENSEVTPLCQMRENKKYDGNQWKTSDVVKEPSEQFSKNRQHSKKYDDHRNKKCDEPKKKGDYRDHRYDERGDDRNRPSRSRELYNDARGSSSRSHHYPVQNPETSTSTSSSRMSSSNWVYNHLSSEDIIRELRKKRSNSNRGRPVYVTDYFKFK